MANPVSFPGDVIVPGNLRVAGSISPAKERSEIMALVELQPFTVPWEAWHIWNSAANAVLPASAADDDLALIPGTWTTGVPSIQTLDFGGTNTTAYARAQIRLPWEYVTGETVKLRFHAGALTTLPDTTLTLDCVVYLSGKESVVSGGDICATAAQDIRSLTMADIDFTITPTTLSPGDMLDVRIAINGVDAGNLGVMTGCIGHVELLCDVR